MSTERFAKTRFTGKGICRWCGKVVPKGRISWCSQECVNEYADRAWPERQRQRVLERDRGICALCGRDCVALKEKIRAWLAVPAEPKMRDEAKRHLRRAKLAGRLGVTDGSAWMPPVRSLWEADHIVPVCEGGGECGPENLRTLCRPCHKRETRALARRRAEARRAARGAPAQTSLDLEAK